MVRNIDNIIIDNLCITTDMFENPAENQITGIYFENVKNIEINKFEYNTYDINGWYSIFNNINVNLIRL